MIRSRENNFGRIWPRSGAFIALAAALILAAAFDRASSPRASAIPTLRDKQRTKISAGEYQVVRPLRGRQGIGGFTTAVYDFHESWTLWRTPDGNLDAEGTRTYESPRGNLHHDQFEVRLSPAMQALRVIEDRKLRWRPDSGPLTCEFHPHELACASGSNADDPKLSLTMQSEYGFFWPISAFCLGGIVHSANRSDAAITPVQLITVNEVSPENPVAATVLDAELKFIRHQNIRVAGRDWDADEFLLKAPGNAPFLLWTSKEGLLLLLGPEGNSISGPETGLQLVRYERFSDF